MCTRKCIVCEEERCSRCCVEEFPPLQEFKADVVRGEERDPVCLVCLAEYKPDDDYSSGESGHEMLQNGS